MSVLGLNAYAGPLSFINSTIYVFGAECQPSGTTCEDVGPESTCTCTTDDTVMYFGYDVGNIVFTAKFANGQSTGWHPLGYGDWAILKDTNDTRSGNQNCDVGGDRNSVYVNFSDE